MIAISYFQIGKPSAAENEQVIVILYLKCIVL